MTCSDELFLTHRKCTDIIASRVQSFYKQGKPFRIYHGGTNSTRRRQYDPDKVIDTSALSNVLFIDRENRVAFVEPNVSMEKLVDNTLPLGLVPPVIMEFPAITVGGGYSGTSGESSSFRHGVFENTVQRIEIILGNGEIVYASRDEHADLYSGAAGSFGTFGVVTMLEIRLMDAKPYVQLEYSFTSGAADAVRAFEAYTDKPEVEYLDGILFSKSQGVIMAGRMVDLDASNAHLPVRQYRRAWDPWFYLRAKELVDHQQASRMELIPLKDYLFRFDRGAFWGGYYSFRYFITPFNRLTRWILDDLLHTEVMYKALHKSGLANEYIVQDIGFPYESVPGFVDYLDQDFGYYPLWLCPLLVRGQVPLRPHLPTYRNNQGVDLRILNVGVWGPGPKNALEFKAKNRDMEHVTKAMGGLKCLYAHAYYTEDEFWSIYDREWYEALRSKYHASLIPSVLDKVTVNDGVARSSSSSAASPILTSACDGVKNMWPVRGVYGAVYVLASPGAGTLSLSRARILLFPAAFVLVHLWGLLVLVWSWLFQRGRKGDVKLS